MSKINTTICLEPSTHELVKRKGWNLSGLVEQAVWAKDKQERAVRGEVDVSEEAQKAGEKEKKRVLEEYAAKEAKEQAAKVASEAHLATLRATYEGLLTQLMMDWTKAKGDFGIKSVEALELAKQVHELKQEAKKNGVVLE